jgi:hypothetical protein
MLPPSTANSQCSSASQIDSVATRAGHGVLVSVSNLRFSGANSYATVNRSLLGVAAGSPAAPSIVLTSLHEGRGGANLHHPDYLRAERPCAKSPPGHLRLSVISMVVVPMVVRSMVVMPMVVVPVIIHWSDSTSSGVARDRGRKRSDRGRLRSAGNGGDSQSCDRNRKNLSNHSVLLELGIHK